MQVRVTDGGVQVRSSTYLGVCCEWRVLVFVFALGHYHVLSILKLHREVEMDFQHLYPLDKHEDDPRCFRIDLKIV